MSGVVYCGCGHTGDEHAGGRCRHLNHDTRLESRDMAIRAKARRVDEQCRCRNLSPDPRLTESSDFVAKVLGKVIAKEAIPIEPVEREDALQVLTIALWKTARKYDSRSHVRFRVYAYLELYNDAIDHLRAERGRNGEKRVYDPRHGIHDVNAVEFHDVEHASAGADRLDGAASRDPADDPDSWGADCGGLLKGGDGSSSGLAA